MKLLENFGFLLLLTMGIVFDCSAPPKTKDGITKVKKEPVRIPVADEKGFFPEYRLGFGDVIEIKIFDNERFNETVAVRPDGRITIEKIGDIFAAGMTPSELDSLITDTYSKFIRKPDVTVFVRQFGSYQVYVCGEVNAPGAFPLQRDMNILQALATAGGPKDTAKLGSVMILRRGSNKNLDALKVDVKSALKGKNNVNPPEVLRVHNQDVIYVPKTAIASTSTFLKQVYDGFLPPLDIYLRAALWWGR
jgi:polysaccharide export outer membrane protein